MLLIKACSVLEESLSNARRSSLYETAPMYFLEQPAFVNMALVAYYDKSPRELLSLCNKVEAQFGRNRIYEKSKGQRTLDIDIVLYGNDSFFTEDLCIPHPRFSERAFVLVPMLEVLSTYNYGFDTSKFNAMLQAIHTRELDVKKICA